MTSRPVSRVLLASLLVGIFVCAPSPAGASHDAPLKSAKKPSPPPVSGVPTREGLRVNTEDRMIHRKPSRPAKKPRDGSASKDTRHQRQAIGDPPRRDNPPTSSADQFNMNIGICGRRMPDGTFPGPARCTPAEPEEPEMTRRRLPPEVAVPRPEDVTWEQVVTESKVVLFPRLSVKVQPKDRTLVNLDTIVYTDASRVSTNTVTLLGFPVVVEATPMSYSWSFGDGSPVLRTTTPGKPYPSKEITHKYMKKGSVGLSLTTNYAARFNVAGTGWQYVDGLIPVTGPVTALQVREAVPVLVEPGG
ncbi:PKD domain-containing protein [Kribbella sp. NPDC050124]|uniref:PKD domain-containing protein n=1 Tax=Kribbella sp. NPDC050124 TaxID=3364114 RepID=UPI0037A54823